MRSDKNTGSNGMFAFLPSKTFIMPAYGEKKGRAPRKSKDVFPFEGGSDFSKAEVVKESTGKVCKYRTFLYETKNILQDAIS